MELPPLTDDAGNLQLGIVEVTSPGEGALGLTLAAQSDEPVGLFLGVELLTGQRVLFPGVLRSIGVPSDGLVQALARSWGISDQVPSTAAPQVDVWLFPPTPLGTPAGRERMFKPEDLKWMTVDFKLQLLETPAPASGDRSPLWLLLHWFGDQQRIAIEVPPADRAAFLRILSGARARGSGGRKGKRG